MRAAGWVAVSGVGAAVAGAGLMFWGWRRSVACGLKMTEEGSQNPFECVQAGAPLMAGGAILGGVGVLTGLIGGAVALVGR